MRRIDGECAKMSIDKNTLGRAKNEAKKYNVMNAKNISSKT
jgi:hypothetical protein